MTELKTEIQLTENKDLREHFISRTEVLEKVKALLLIPQMEVMTIRQVADFYEVPYTTIKSQFDENEDEFVSDGVVRKNPKDFKIFKDEKSVFKELRQEHGKLIIQINDNITLEIPNRGIRVFPKRAILRMGMLLRDSKIAKEVRTQLLNIEEHADTATKLAEITEEESLIFDLTKAILNRQDEKAIIGLTSYVAYKNRYIDKLENENIKLHTDNMALAQSNLKWENRKALNSGVRRLACKVHTKFDYMWAELYKNLLYKYGINLKGRGDSPYIQHIRKDEWDKVIKTFCSLCEAYGQSPTEMIGETKIKEDKKDEKNRSKSKAK